MQLDRSLTLFRTCQSLGQFGSWPNVDALYADLRSHADGAAMRDFLSATYGAAWTVQLLDL